MERFVASFIRPHGVDRRATPIFADTIEHLAASPRPQPQTTPPWAPGAWRDSHGIGRGRRRRLAAAQPLKPVHRALEKAGHRSKKTVVRTLAVARERVKRRAKLIGKQWQKSVVKPLERADRNRSHAPTRDRRQRSLAGRLAKRSRVTRGEATAPRRAARAHHSRPFADTRARTFPRPARPRYICAPRSDAASPVIGCLDVDSAALSSKRGVR